MSAIDVFCRPDRPPPSLRGRSGFTQGPVFVVIPRGLQAKMLSFMFL